jgi:hypothetical protein
MNPNVSASQDGLVRLDSGVRQNDGGEAGRFDYRLLAGLRGPECLQHIYLHAPRSRGTAWQID